MLTKLEESWNLIVVINGS